MRKLVPHICQRRTHVGHRRCGHRLPLGIPPLGMSISCGLSAKLRQKEKRVSTQFSDSKLVAKESRHPK
jgi:hypothetical protein